ncbi:MAG: glycerophosphodiester phosphodiesterase [Pseudomonas sp.]|uniref:glycerophosphodiester phosphodiesterase n=1 Tax=Pseudomonas sp. TaxID=306 RepID=UPI003391AD02
MPLNLRTPISRWLLGACLLLAGLPSQATLLPTDTHTAPLIIAHRGASGYVPEHTLAAYALAILQGADSIEPDLVMTRDGHLVARHDNELGLTTDVSQHPEFAARKRTQSVDGVPLSGWFSEDFSLAELKTLHAIERIPTIRPGNARLDRAFEIPTLQEIIDLVKSLQLSQQRRIGLYPETKHPSHFQRLGLAMERPLVRLLHRNGYFGASAPVHIQSFEVDNLKTLRGLTRLRLVQLLGAGQPYDQQLRGSPLTYTRMATPEGLRDIARYASGVGPDKAYIIPRDAAGNLGQPTAFIANAHAVGLKVHPYTFRAENAFLPSDLRQGSDPAGRGDLETEIRAFLAAGVDGLFTDQADIAVRVRAAP